MRLGTMLYHFLAARWRWRRLRGQRLRDFQDARATELIRYAIAHSPFYHRHFQAHDSADWRALPTIDKAAMMANFDDFNTERVRRDDAMAVALHAETSRDFRPTIEGLTVGLSSGTSGHRGLFLVSPREQAAWAGFLLARTLPALRLRGYSIAFFLRSNSNLYETLGSGWLRFRYHDVMTPLPQAIASLNASPPDFLVAPPSMLGMLADAQESGVLRIRPERLISVAEVLELQDHARLAEVFGCPVHQIYQCTEGLLAVSCPHGSLHLQEDLVAVQLEPLAATDEVQRYTPIVTDLWRRTQPIIRYRLNDVVTLDPNPCPCGSEFRILAGIEGRCDDLLAFITTEGRERIFFPDTIRRMILLSSADIVDYQAFQDRPGNLQLRVELSPGVDFAEAARALRESAMQTMTQYDCRFPELTIKQGLQAVPSGAKRRRIRRIAAAI